MEPWWTPEQGNLWGAVVGGAIGVLGGLMGLLLGAFSRRGKFRRLLLGVEVALLAVGALCLGAGLFAVASSQPYMVWYPLTLIGLLLSVLMPTMIWVTRIRYANVETRRLAAEQLRRS